MSKKVSEKFEEIEEFATVEHMENEFVKCLKGADYEVCGDHDRVFTIQRKFKKPLKITMSHQTFFLDDTWTKSKTVVFFYAGDNYTDGMCFHGVKQLLQEETPENVWIECHGSKLALVNARDPHVQIVKDMKHVKVYPAYSCTYIFQSFVFNDLDRCFSLMRGNRLFRNEVFENFATAVKILSSYKHVAPNTVGLDEMKIVHQEDTSKPLDSGKPATRSVFDFDNYACEDRIEIGNQERLF